MDDLERLHAEIESLKTARRKDALEKHDDKLADRRLPPMSQMTRMQKRYFLEPWMTVLTVTSWGIAVLSFVLGMFTPLHVEFSMLGTLFVLVGVGFLVGKLNLMDWNSRTEGELHSRASRDY